MAAPTASRPGRALAVTAFLLVVLAGAMFLRSATTPELGLDLQGGTSVTLVPKKGSTVTDENLAQAVEIIRQRVDAFGVAESEVTTQGGRNIIISVPGSNQRELVRLVGKTAQLSFRQVLQAAGPLPAGAQTPAPTPSPAPDTSPAPGGTASPDGASPAPQQTANPGSSPERTSGRALSKVLMRGQGEGAQAGPAPAQAPTPQPPAPQPTTPTVPQAPAPNVPPEVAKQFAELDCTKPQNRRGGRDVAADEYLVTCDENGAQKFVLAPASVQGRNVSSASAQLAQGAGWQVLLNFDSTGTSKFSQITQEVYQQPPPNNQVAIVLDGLVVSAPAIQEPIPGGQAQITGQFSQSEAENLANVLKFGALPIAFDLGEVLTISPTLGRDQLNAGLLAGAIGLALVVLYSMAYYRMLGIVVIASLAVAGVITYATVALLGDIIGFRLTLAGVAGLIVAIGITADSFIVYFERLRDEVREGRSLRAAVEYGWMRARRTILTADAVSLLAALVLYLLSVGSVRGFAFTLGLTTVVDVVVVFVFTKPLVAALARTKFFAEGHPMSGLDPTRLGATKRAPSEVLTGRRRPKEA